jgi:PIN domain nuclease of toxin-antitoxin system
VRLLLDSCTFLWLIWDEPELSHEARIQIADPRNEVYLSSISLWEILLKHQAGRLALAKPIDPERYYVEQREAHRIAPLPVTEEAVVQMIKLPLIHRDPFDRMLICQAIAHGLVVCTPDRSIQQYPVRTLW